MELFCGCYVRQATNVPTLLVLSGNSGTGKTHLAKCIFRFCNAAHYFVIRNMAKERLHVPWCLFVRWPEMAKKDKDTYAQWTEDMKSCDLLVIDDAGAEHDPWKESKDLLCQILTRRERKFTVITTNISPANWATSFDTRIDDRLKRGSAIVDFDGVPSYAVWKMRQTV